MQLAALRLLVLLLPLAAGGNAAGALANGRGGHRQLRAAANNSASAAEPAPATAADGSALNASLPTSNTTLSVPADAAAMVSAVGVPDRCIVGGSGLFSSCSREIAGAMAHFNVTVNIITPQNYTQLLAARGVTVAQVMGYLQQALASPSASCCSAFCRFNQQLRCDCEAAVMAVLVMFTGADPAFYDLLVAQLAVGCQTRLIDRRAANCNSTSTSDSSTTSLADGRSSGGGRPDVLNCLPPLPAGQQQPLPVMADGNVLVNGSLVGRL